MNIFLRIGCRIYQRAFRLALPLLPYREPVILQSMEQIAYLLREKHKERVLIVTDGTLSRIGLTAPLTDALSAGDIAFTVYDRTVQNPTIDNVEEAKEMYSDFGAQAIIAFGGGSSLDCAKAAGARIVRPKMSVQKMRGLLKIHRKLPLLIAIPTTAGTGSETTLAAVITDAETHYKYPINDFSLIPHYAVLDPEITRSLPPSLTATTGMDALTHAVEAYIGGSTTAHTRAMAVEAVTLIFRWLERAYRDGNDLEARGKMLRASYCAGIAFTQSYVGYVHGVAHSLGGQYSVPHGLANAVILPYFLTEYGTACQKKLAKLARACGLCDGQIDDADAAKAFIDKIKQMNADMGIPETIPEIREEDIPLMAKRASRESNPLYPVPKLMNADELACVYRKIAGKESV